MFTTVSQLKTYLGIVGNDFDSLLELMIGATTDFVKNACNRDFSEFSPIPKDIELLTLELAAATFNQRAADGKTTESFDGSSLSWERDLTPNQKRIIGFYKLWHV